MTTSAEPVTADVVLPREARGFQRERAGIVSRVLAAGIDLGVVAALVGLAVAGRSLWRFFFASEGVALTLHWPTRFGLVSIGGILLAIYLAWGWARTGRTVGKRVLGLVVVGRDGGPLPLWKAIVRAVLYVLFPLGLLWSAVSRTNRSVQDAILGTAVRYAWHRPRPATTPSA